MNKDAYPDLDCCDPVEWGLDLTLLDHALQQTPTERWLSNANAAELMYELERLRDAAIRRDPESAPR